MLVLTPARLESFRRLPTLSFSRSIGSSLLDANVFAAAQKMAAKAEVDNSRSALRTLKMQMPTNDEHVNELRKVNQASKGLWYLWPSK